MKRVRHGVASLKHLLEFLQEKTIPEGDNERSMVEFRE
jgi:hypothetical protein